MENLLRSVHHHPSVKPFVCVSMCHDDLKDELLYLTESVFPKISDLYEARGSLFSPVLITLDPKEYENNKPYRDYIILTYLTSITESAPYFISLLGNDYGIFLPMGNFDEGGNTEFDWYKKNIDTAAKYGYKWVLDEDTRHASLLEIGITEAAFRHKNDFCYFYYKEAETHENPMVSIDKLGRNKVGEKKLKGLKQQIIDTELPVSMFSSIEDLGNLIWRDWTKVLDILYPPFDKQLLTPPMEAFLDNQLRIESRVNYYEKFFLHSRTTEDVIISLRKHVEPLVIKDKREQTFFIPKYRDQPQEIIGLDSAAEKEVAKPIIVISGSRGSGKTALVSNFLKQIKPLKLSCPLFVHFCDGFCGRNILSFIKHIIIRMRYFYKRDRISLFDSDYLPCTSDLVASFHNCLTFGPCIIVVDGIDYVANSVFSSEKDTRNIPWLPMTFPTTSRLILTTTDTDHSIKTLGLRSDTHRICLNSFLTSDQISTLVSKPLIHPNRTLVVDQVKKLNNVHHQGNPLFAIVLANLIGHWSTQGLFDKLLPAVYEPSHIGTLWRSIIQVWTQEIGWYLPSSSSDSAQSSSKRHATGNRTMLLKAQTCNGWVADVLRLMAVSRNGISETALLACLKEIGYREDCTVSLIDLKAFRIASRIAIVDDHRGYLKFSHPSLLEAVDRMLLRGLTYPSPHRPVSPFKHEWENQKERFHRIVAAYTRSLQHSSEKIMELPWHFLMVKDPFALEEVLSEVPCFLTLTSSFTGSDFMADLTEYIKYLEGEKFKLDDIVIELLERANMRVETTPSMVDVDMDYERSDLLQCLIMKPETDSLTPAEFVCLQYYAGRSLMHFGYKAAAESVLLAASKLGYIALDVFDQDMLSYIQLALGEFYLKDGQIDAAKIWFTKAEKTAADLANTAYIDTYFLAYIRGKIIDYQTYSRIVTELRAITIPTKHHYCRPHTSGSYRSQGTRPASVVRTRLIVPESRLASSRSSPPRSATSQDYNPIYSTMKGHLELAGKYFERAGSQEGKAKMLHHLGVLAGRCRMPEESEFYLRESISIYREWFGNWHPTLAEVLDDLALTLASHGRIESNLRLSEAEELVREGTDVKKQACGEANINTARSYCQLARILVTKRRRDAYREAKELFQRALDILVVEKGFYHPEAVSIRKTLFELHKEVPSHQRREHSVTFPSVTKKSTTPLRFLKS